MNLIRPSKISANSSPNSIIIIKIQIACKILLLMSIISGCSAFPVEKNNILASPINIEMTATDGARVKPLKEFKAEVLNGLDTYMLDDLGRRKAAEFVSKRYEDEFVDKKVNGKILIEKALRISLSNADSFIIPGIVRKDSTPSTELTNFKMTWSGDNGLGEASYVTEWYSGFDSSPSLVTGTSELSISLKLKSSSNSIIADIYDISYNLDCSYDEPNLGCITTRFYGIDEKALIDSISTAKTSSNMLTSVSDFKTALRSYLKTRYKSHKKETFNKIDRTYDVDFATAKSRLQRAMGAFKYDNKNSAFVIDNKFDNPVAGNNSKIKHQYVISLFPDKENTVIEFSGEYESFKDSFGGSDKFGQKTFEAEMNGYIKSVDKALKK